MKSHQRLLAFFSFAVLLCTLLLACRQSSIGPDDIPFQVGAPFTLEVGQSALLEQESLTLTFDSVIGDHRCPSQVQCAEQGAVEILVTVKEANQASETHEMNPEPALARLTWAPSTVTYQNYEINLQAVSPYPELPEDLEDFDDYEATFVVSE